MKRGAIEGLSRRRQSKSFYEDELGMHRAQLAAQKCSSQEGQEESLFSAKGCIGTSLKQPQHYLAIILGH